MLKREDIEIKVEGFTIAEVDPEASAEFRDELAEEYKDKGKSKFLYALTSGMFALRVKAWPFKEECTEENKLEFYRRYPDKANELTAAAEKKIQKKREKLLGNLLSGASGT